jgi:hypothetical protein
MHPFMKLANTLNAVWIYPSNLIDFDTSQRILLNHFDWRIQQKRSFYPIDFDNRQNTIIPYYHLLG